MREGQPWAKNVVAFCPYYSGARLFAAPQDVDVIFMLHLCRRGLAVSICIDRPDTLL
jgi:hypothetical protein